MKTLLEYAGLAGVLMLNQVALAAAPEPIHTQYAEIGEQMELTYLGDFSDFNQFSVIPELLLPYKMLDLKAGVEVGLGRNGNELGSTAANQYPLLISHEHSA